MTIDDYFSSIERSLRQNVRLLPISPASLRYWLKLTPGSLLLIPRSESVPTTLGPNPFPYLQTASPIHTELLSCLSLMLQYCYNRQIGFSAAELDAIRAAAGVLNQTQATGESHAVS